MDSISSLLPISATLEKSGYLRVAGHDLRLLVEQYGSPLYLYDQQTFTNQVQRLEQCLDRYYPGEHQVTYAAKAYFSLKFARRLQEVGLGVDVVSLGEMAIARQAGFTAARVHLHGNNKSIDEINTALDWGIQSIVIDNLDELALIETLASAQQKIARVWLRISPDVVVDTHAFLQTAHAASKFGLPIQDGQAGQAIRQILSSRWIELRGLHVHLGSQFVQPEPYREAIHRLAVLADENGYIPKEISPGGGWGVPYLPGQPEDDPQAWIQTVAETLQQECQKRRWNLPCLVVEPGRWLVARAGLAVYTVGSVKTTQNGTRYIAVDGGMSDNPRPALYAAQYTAVLPERMTALPLIQSSIVGKFCESGDKMIQDVWLPEARRGDLLAIPVAGAYQLSMASNYNLAARPAVLWLERDKVEVLQQREQPQDGGWWTGE